MNKVFIALAAICASVLTLMSDYRLSRNAEPAPVASNSSGGSAAKVEIPSDSHRKSAVSRPSALKPRREPRNPASAPALPLLEPDPVRAANHSEPMDSDADLTLLKFGLMGKEPDSAEWEWIAGRASSDYRMTADAFKKQDLFAGIKAKGQAQMRAYRERYFVMTVPVYLGHYDLGSSSFALHDNLMAGTPWSVQGPWTRVRNTQPLTLSVANMKAFTHFKMSDQDTARQLEALAPVWREWTAKVYLFAQDVSQGSVEAKIVKIQLFDNRVRLRGEIE